MNIQQQKIVIRPSVLKIILQGLGVVVFLLGLIGLFQSGLDNIDVVTLVMLVIFSGVSGWYFAASASGRTNIIFKQETIEIPETVLFRKRVEIPYKNIESIQEFSREYVKSASGNNWIVVRISRSLFNSCWKITLNEIEIEKLSDTDVKIGNNSVYVVFPRRFSVKKFNATLFQLGVQNIVAKKEVAEINPKIDRDVWFPKKPTPTNIIIKDISKKQLQDAIQNFEDLYNKDRIVLEYKLKEKELGVFEITFPKGILFEFLCHFVNYLYYPAGTTAEEYSPTIYAYTIVNTEQVSFRKIKKIEGKEVMLYVPKTDDEYDNVYAVTKNNEHYKIGFAVGEGVKKIEDPQQYINQE